MRDITYKEKGWIDKRWCEIRELIKDSILNEKNETAQRIRSCVTTAHENWRLAKRELNDNNNYSGAANYVSTMRSNVEVVNKIKGSESLRAFCGALKEFEDHLRQPDLKNTFTRCTYGKEAQVANVETDESDSGFPIYPEKSQQPEKPKYEGGGERAFMTHLSTDEIEHLLKDPHMSKRVAVTELSYDVLLYKEGALQFKFEHRFTGGRTIWEYPATGHPTL